MNVIDRIEIMIQRFRLFYDEDVLANDHNVHLALKELEKAEMDYLNREASDD